MRRATLGAVLGLLACEGDGPTRWRVELGPGLAPLASAWSSGESVIVAGTCADASAIFAGAPGESRVLYQSTVTRTTPPALPPLLGRGPHAFAVRLALVGCGWVVEGCVEVDLQRSPRAVVTTVLGAIGPAALACIEDVLDLPFPDASVRDGGLMTDAGPPSDTGAPLDTGPRSDAAARPDGGPGADGGPGDDAGRCAPPCAAHQACCDGLCRNVMTDPGTCGDCRTACGLFETCAGGACRCATGAPGCVAPRLCCPTAGGGGPVCVDTQTDSSHCGGCGRGCANGTECRGGNCVCPGGSATCPGGRACCRGECCPAGFMCCDGACVDPSQNTSHCGSCGVDCGSGSCAGGACVCTGTTCARGESCCGGECATVTSNPRHCGACDRRCGTGEVCMGSYCYCGAVFSSGAVCRANDCCAAANTCSSACTPDGGNS